MSPELLQRAVLHAMIDACPHLHVEPERVDAAIRAVVEACAQVCEHEAHVSFPVLYRAAASRCAEEIRALSAAKGLKGGAR